METSLLHLYTNVFVSLHERICLKELTPIFFYIPQVLQPPPPSKKISFVQGGKIFSHSEEELYF